MTINELEANEVIRLIEALRHYEKHRSAIFIVAHLLKHETINEDGSVNKASMKYLKSFEKKLRVLLRDAKKK